jgi:hypothetical protein
VLREDPPAVGEDVELTAPARRHLRVDPERLTQLGRETRSPLVVPASGGAEEDLDGHAWTLVTGVRATERLLDGLELLERLE